MERFKLAIIIPAFNEEKTISKIVRKSKKYGKVLVINDASNDKTMLLAKKNGAQVFNNDKNLGYCSSINLGIKKALNSKFTHLITLDADGEHSADNIKYFVNEFKSGKKLIFGVREKKQRFSELIFCKYFNFFFGVKDILCGMRGIKLSSIDYKKVKIFRYDIGLSVVYYLLFKKISFSQVSITGKKRIDKPRFGNILKSNFKILFSLLNYLFYKRNYKLKYNL